MGTMTPTSSCLRSLVSALLTVVVLLCGGLANAQNLRMAALTIPADLRENASSVVREYDQTYRSESPREASVRVRYVVTLLNDNHDRENQLVVYYDDDTHISRFRATLYDALGQKVREAKKSEIEDVRALSGGQFYTDSRVRTVTLSHLSYPYTVEFEYELKMKDFGAVNAPIFAPQDYDEAVEHARFTALIREGNELRYRGQHLPEPTVTSEEGYAKYVWEVENLPARRSEPYAPVPSATLPFLRTALADFAVGDLQLTNRDWETFGKQMLQLHQDIRTLPPTLAAAVEETTAGLTTDREKIAALYKLLQGRTRYVGVQLGIGGWQPFSAEYVESNRYGDCKALSNYMGAMLDAVDIDNYPVLVHWSDRPYLPVEADFTASAFNHMILYVPGEDLYLECTSNSMPTGYLGDGKQDRNVVWLTPEGGKLVRTPAHEPGENGHVRTTELTLQADGKAELDLRAGYFGASHENLRRFFHAEADRSEQLDYLHRRGVLPDVKGTEYTVSVAPDDPELELSYRTVLPRYARKMGSRTFLPLNKLFRIDAVPDKVADRQFPVVTHRARFYVDTVRLSLPDNLEVESLGEPLTTIDHPAGEYRAEVKTSPGQLTWIRTLKLVPVELPAADYEGFRDFFVAVSKAERRQVVLREKRTR